MSVDQFFAVPILVRDADAATRDAISAKVKTYLDSDLARQHVTPSPEESVTTSYYKPERSILEDADLSELENFVLSAARAFLDSQLGPSSRRLEIERAWINVFEPGAQEALHTHDGSLLSCSYYVEAPENCGCIVFPDPIGERRSYRQFTRTSGSNLQTRPEIAIAPKAGRLVMFESWFGHAVQCNKSDKVRISIAINLKEASAAGVPSADEDDSAVDAGRPVAESAGHDGQARMARDKPFLFNELFDVFTNLHLSATAVADVVPAVVIDDVLKHPDRVREVVGSMPAANWKHEAGGRNFVDYYDCRLRFPVRFPTSLISVAQKAIQQIYGAQTRPADASVDVNWFMQINSKRADSAVPHCDMTENVKRSFTCIVYLNSTEECSGGTAFFRFRQSNSLVFDAAYARAAQSDARIVETGMDYWPRNRDETWEQVGTVDMATGRMLIFPSEYFHAAYHPSDSFFEFPRLTLAFWMVC